MKIATKDDSARAECHVKLDGNAAQEFELSVPTDGEGPFGAYIPVVAGQKVTVDAACNANTKDVYFDLIVDGILRATLTSTSKKFENKRHTAKFTAANHMHGGKVTEVDLVVKDLVDVDTEQGDGSQTLGCIEVRIWVLLDDKQERHHQADVKSFEACSDWRELDGSTPNFTTVQPTQEIECVPNDFNPLLPIKITLLRKRIAAARPGDKPWASFKFFYRKQDATNEAAMTKIPNYTKKNTLRWTPPAVKLVGADQADDDEAEGSGESDETKSSIPVNGEAADSTSSDLNPDLGSQDPPTQDQNLEGSAASTKLPSTSPSVKELSFKVNDPEFAEYIRIKTENPEPDHSNLFATSDMPPKQRKSSRGKTSEPEPYQSSIANRDELIKEYESTVAEFGDISEEAKDLLLAEHLKSKGKENEQEPDLEPEVEPKADIEGLATPKPLATVQDYPSSAVGILAPLPVAATVTPKSSPSPSSIPATPATPVKKLAAANAFKRKASMTPDGANKKLKSDNAAAAKKIAEMEARLEARKKHHAEMVAKTDQAEVQRKADLARRMAELEAELEAVEGAIEDVEGEYEETMSHAAASQREDSVLAE